MLFDDMNMFSKDQAVAANAVSERVVDIRKAGDAKGNELMLLVRSVTDPVGGGTIQVQFRTSDTLDGNGALVSPKILVASGAIAAADAKAGRDILYVRVPYGAKRYLDLHYTVAGFAGTIWAGLTFDK